MGDRTLFIFSDFVCPICYLAVLELARVREAGVAVEPAAFELRPPGIVLMNEAEMRQSIDAAAPLADEIGVRMQYPGFTTRTRKAHEAVAWARASASGTELHQRILHAYWQERRDIGRIDVLVEIASEAGLDAMGLKVALDIDQWTSRVERDEEWAAQLELAGVPAYVLAASLAENAGAAGAGPAVAGRTRIGMQRHDELMDWVADDNDV